MEWRNSDPAVTKADHVTVSEWQRSDDYGRWTTDDRRFRSVDPQMNDQLTFTSERWNLNSQKWAMKSYRLRMIGRCRLDNSFSSIWSEEIHNSYFHYSDWQRPGETIMVDRGQILSQSNRQSTNEDWSTNFQKWAIEFYCLRMTNVQQWDLTKCYHLRVTRAKRLW